MRSLLVRLGVALLLIAAAAVTTTLSTAMPLSAPERLPGLAVPDALASVPAWVTAPFEAMGNMPTVHPRPDGGSVVIAGNTVRFYDHSGAVVAEHAVRAPWQPSFGADRIAVGTRSGGLYIFNYDGGVLYGAAQHAPDVERPAATITARDSSTQTIAPHKTAARIIARAVDDGRVYAIGEPRQLWVFDRAGRLERHVVELPLKVQGNTNFSVGPQGQLLLATINEGLACVEPDGRLRWHKDVLASGFNWLPDGSCILGLEDDIVRLDPQGHETWRFALGYGPETKWHFRWANLRLGAPGVLVAWQGQFAILDPATGAPTLRRSIPGVRGVTDLHADGFTLMVKAAPDPAKVAELAARPQVDPGLDPERFDAVALVRCDLQGQPVATQRIEEYVLTLSPLGPGGARYAIFDRSTWSNGINHAALACFDAMP
jgi:hypothetical protein